MAIDTAVIPIAGKGTRFLPVTKGIPKEMIPILDRPVIHYIVQEVIMAGLSKIIFITSSGKEAVESYFDRNRELEHFLLEGQKSQSAQLVKDIGQMIEVATVRQKEQLGLGHALLCAGPFLEQKNFVVLLGDEIFLPSKTTSTAISQLLHISKQYGEASVIGAVKIPKDQTNRYGIIDGKDEGDGKTFMLNNMVEKPSPNKAPSSLAAPGRYVFTPLIFDYLKQIKKGREGEYQLTDAINLMAKENPVYSHIIEGDRYDVGHLLGYLKATVEFALQREETKEYTKKLLREQLKR